MKYRLCRTLQGIVGSDMIEGVLGKQAFCLGSSEERVITAHEGDGVLVARQELAVTQGDCQLYSIIGLQGMGLRQMRCGFQVARGQRDDSIPMDELAVEPAISRSRSARLIRPTRSITASPAATSTRVISAIKMR